MEMYHLVAQTCDCEGEPDLEQRFRKAMKAARDHWMAPSDDEAFRGAVAAVLLSKDTTEDEKARIYTTLDGLKALSALIAGVPVDLAAVADGMKDGPKPLPLSSWWREVKAA